MDSDVGSNSLELVLLCGGPTSPEDNFSKCLLVMQILDLLFCASWRGFFHKCCVVTQLLLKCSSQVLSSL